MCQDCQEKIHAHASATGTMLLIAMSFCICAAAIFVHSNLGHYGKSKLSQGSATLQNVDAMQGHRAPLHLPMAEGNGELVCQSLT